MAVEPKPHVVVVGGGFGGLYAAKVLCRHDLFVTLIDRHNFHLFQPLLYQVATASLAPSDIAAPIRYIFQKCPNIRVLLGEVSSIEPAAHRIVYDGGHLEYDYLLLAPGSGHTYFGHDVWSAMAPSLKFLEDAIEIRKRILLAFESAERSTSPVARRALLTFVVVGGGPTGVELAGAIAEIANATLRRDFKSIDPTEARIVLIEAGPRLLAGFPEDLARAAVRMLSSLGVEILTSAMVTDIAQDKVCLGERTIACYTTLWAAGVAASPLASSLGGPLDQTGRVLVSDDLSVPGHPEIFVVGDLAAALGADGRPLPGVAPVAMQEGRAAAHNILRSIKGLERQHFVFHPRGNLATIGRRRAVADIKGLHLTGFVAWVAWIFVHIAYLISFQNRAIVLFKWAWAYFTGQRGSRLIIGSAPYPLPPGPIGFAPIEAHPATVHPTPLLRTNHHFLHKVLDHWRRRQGLKK